MKILIAGGTGFVGRYLIPALLQAQHSIIVLGRDKNKIANIFHQTVVAASWDELNTINPNEVDAVINLVGENIGDHRWTETIKNKIIQSRVDSTTRLVKWCASANKKPHLYNTSAVGIYGLQPINNTLPPAFSEEADIPFGHPADFLSEVGQTWEWAAHSADEVQVPVTIMRFGVVLKRNEAVLKKLSMSFYIGLGGRVGSGKQAFTWIHIDDLVRAILFLLDHPDIVGPVNLCAPECVSQMDFAKTLAHVMHRPCIFSTPAWLLKLLFGQMADELLLNGQCAYSKRLLASGFTFLYPSLKSALQHEWR
ncbi:MAG: hypothetical protein ACD_46C00291G0010 [uncultured bacterium]|nr:MAG: hypothetical protein ACD_46C00291G0010 [uncultured bacterium]